MSDLCKFGIQPFVIVFSNALIVYNYEGWMLKGSICSFL